MKQKMEGGDLRTDESWKTCSASLISTRFCCTWWSLIHSFIHSFLQSHCHQESLMAFISSLLLCTPVLHCPICVFPSIGFITSSLSRWCLSNRAMYHCLFLPDNLLPLSTETRAAVPALLGYRGDFHLFWLHPECSQFSACSAFWPD